MSLFDKTTNALQTSLAMRQMRHSITAENVANAETPGYHAQKLDFEEALSRSLDTEGLRSMSTSNENHFVTGGGMKAKPDIYDNPDAAVNNDGNTVDLAKEMSGLAENAIMYKTALSLINKKLAALKYAASEGR